VVLSNTKEFLEASPISTDYQRNKKKRTKDDDYFGLNLSEINLELDNNSNFLA